MMGVIDKADVYVHQDANWNVMGLTTPGAKVAEEYNYTPYGRMYAKRHTALGATVCFSERHFFAVSG